MPLFKDEQVLIIAPGSQTTLAQLGIPESLTPAQLRVRSRMFKGETPDKYEPFRVRPKEALANGAPKTEEPEEKNSLIHEPEFYEDQETEEGAIWPIQQGRIVDWAAFFGLFEYVYNRLSPGFHTPICLVGQPCWTVKDQQKITQYIFEKFRPPAFTIADSALCALFAHGNVDNACVVDVGFEKADVTAIVNYNIHLSGRQIAVPDCGGDAFTARLQELLASKKWSREMCEQLKKSTICEILPPGIPLPGTKEAEKVDKIANPASAASTGASASGPGHRDTAGAAGDLPLGPGPGTQVGSEAVLDGNEEGVLDIAKIVGSGSTKDFIAQKEKEKSEKVALKKGQKLNAAEQAQQNKNARMLNRDRATASFIYSDYAFLDAIKGNKSMTAEERTQAHAAVDEGSKQTQAEKSAAAEHTTGNAMDVDAPKTGISSLIHTKAPRRELEVGNERFQAATGGAIDRIADAIQRTISSVNEVAKRSELWDNLVIVGNGAKIRGFREALLATIQSRYIISPSSATIFTSELPSNLTTPMGTGSQTPQPGHHPSHPMGPSGGGNPLLLAATTAHLQPHHLHPPSTPGAPHSNAGANVGVNVHSSHGQTPTSAKYAVIGDYFPEWKEMGYDEAWFLGAQVLARVVFVTSDASLGGGGGAQQKYFMTRTDYNEVGPGGIGDFGL